MATPVPAYNLALDEQCVALSFMMAGFGVAPAAAPTAAATPVAPAAPKAASKKKEKKAKKEEKPVKKEEDDDDFDVVSVHSRKLFMRK
mmetsp:Transcript_22024/g.34218  ORF Transcript_22024/g.34218 Transcript_22024/m.34218 type:complete len:88 (-) Transcript_22024:79-342(-)